VPSEEEAAHRREKYWKPYHEALIQELARLREVHGGALLWDAHSIRSRVPHLFDGVLPDFNWGTGGGSSAAQGLAEELARIVQLDGRYSAVANGRFTGGYITRQYGRPAHNVHAAQLELSQRNYMEEQMPYRYDYNRADMIQPLLQKLVGTALGFVAAKNGENVIAM
jgi:N-formylglutamate deformylase